MSNNPYDSPQQSGNVPIQPSGFRFSWWKLLAGIGLVVVLVALLLPARRAAPEASRRSQCGNNLKQIGLALHNYHAEHKAFPPAFTVDNAGKPLHSWRTLILPYLEQKRLYDSIDLGKAWNDPANQKAAATEIQVYRCPSTSDEPHYTRYLAVVGEHCAFSSNGSRRFQDFRDGTTDTLLVVEIDAAHAVPWMSPRDASEATVLNLGSAEQLSHPGGTQALLADSSVRFLKKDSKPELLQALISIDGGEVIPEGR